MDMSTSTTDRAGSTRNQRRRPLTDRFYTSAKRIINAIARQKASPELVSTDSSVDTPPLSPATLAVSNKARPASDSTRTRKSSRFSFIRRPRRHVNTQVVAGKPTGRSHRASSSTSTSTSSSTTSAYDPIKRYHEDIILHHLNMVDKAGLGCGVSATKHDLRTR